MPTHHTVVVNTLSSIGAFLYLSVFVGTIALLIYETIMLKREKLMKMQVYLIDAWADPDGGWTYNNSIPVTTVYIEGEPTPRKILNALKRRDLINTPVSNYYVDDSFVFDGTWCVQYEPDDYKPVYDLTEIR